MEIINGCSNRSTALLAGVTQADFRRFLTLISTISTDSVTPRVRQQRTWVFSATMNSPHQHTLSPPWLYCAEYYLWLKMIPLMSNRPRPSYLRSRVLLIGGLTEVRLCFHMLSTESHNFRECSIRLQYCFKFMIRSRIPRKNVFSGDLKYPHFNWNVPDKRVIFFSE